MIVVSISMVVLVFNPTIDDISKPPLRTKFEEYFDKEIFFKRLSNI